MKKFLLSAENYVLSLLTKKLYKEYLFHNVSNTQRVVNSIKELIDGEKISEVDANILLFASWFHDIGYINRKENHIEASVNIATTFLEEYNIDNSIIDAVVRLIRVTKPDVEANDFLGKILKDAVSSYYAENSFIDKSKLLKEEINLLFNKKLTELEWNQKNIKAFVKEHRFYTKYAQETWQQGKDKNLAKLVKIKKKLLKDKSSENKLEVALKIHQSLTLKATILLAVNGLIIFSSLVVYYFVNGNVRSYKALFPVIILLFFNGVTALSSLFVALPFDLKKEIKQDFLNQKISFKSKILRYSYIVFTVGIFISLIIFIIRETRFLN
ncbi:hypothetical protein KCTC32516_00420 [Polaribacter huanghezhanensis]|uniref:HD domain-containing protein n=1 Tax=Polaribacter huanghezhanensis TaxID=1354726 RepID=UPI002647F51E|nr:hypothetical protein [Polaribacter huanghezhanensis]WKD85081.1 hypothetical protein KCTC32516_00420 [Polaribacter huanghezhanensis]